MFTIKFKKVLFNNFICYLTLYFDAAALNRLDFWQNQTEARYNKKPTASLPESHLQVTKQG